MQQDNHPFWPGLWCIYASWDGFATADLYWACCQPAPPDPFLWGCSPAMLLPIHTCGKYFSITAFVLVQFHAMNGCPVLQSIQIPLQGLLSLERVNSTFQFSIISKLPTPVSRSLINILNRTVPETEPWDNAGDWPPARFPITFFETCSSLNTSPAEPCTGSLHSRTACLEECCGGQNKKP